MADTREKLLNKRSACFLCRAPHPGLQRLARHREARPPLPSPPGGLLCPLYRCTGAYTGVRTAGNEAAAAPDYSSGSGGGRHRWEAVGRARSCEEESTEGPRPGSRSSRGWKDSPQRGASLARPRKGRVGGGTWGGVLRVTGGSLGSVLRVRGAPGLPGLLNGVDKKGDGARPGRMRGARRLPQTPPPSGRQHLHGDRPPPPPSRQHLCRHRPPQLPACPRWTSALGIRTEGTWSPCAGLWPTVGGSVGRPCSEVWDRQAPGRRQV